MYERVFCFLFLSWFCFLRSCVSKNVLIAAVVFQDLCHHKESSPALEPLEFVGRWAGLKEAHQTGGALKGCRTWGRSPVARAVALLVEEEVWGEISQMKTGGVEDIRKLKNRATEEISEQKDPHLNMFLQRNQPKAWDHAHDEELWESWGRGKRKRSWKQKVKLKNVILWTFRKHPQQRRWGCLLIGR